MVSRPASMPAHIRKMDRLQKCIEILRVLAKQPEYEANRLRIAEWRINEYLRPDVVALRSSLERLGNAASAEAEMHPSESSFWGGVQDYVGSCLFKLPGD